MTTVVCVDLAMAKQKALESNLTVCSHLNQKLPYLVVFFSTWGAQFIFDVTTSIT